MKKSFIALAILAGLLSTSCNNEENVNITTDNDLVEVSLRLGGDFIETSYTPMTRANEANKTYYGIEVLSCPIQDNDNYYYEDYYNNYSSGLFDNTSDMKISLERGYKYKFICYVVKDGVDKIYVNESGRTGTYPYNGLAVENHFASNGHSAGAYFTHTTLTIDNGYSYTTAYEPRVEGIYVGELSDYIPKKDEVIDIALKAMPKYAIKYTVNPPSFGTITVTGPDFEKTLSADDEPYVETIPARIFATQKSTGFNNWAEYYSKDPTQNYSSYKDVSIQSIADFTQDLYKVDYVSINWERPNAPSKYYNKKIAMKTNTITNVTITLNAEELGESAFTINIPEDEEMGTMDKDISIESGVLIEEEINPQY